MERAKLDDSSVREERKGEGGVIDKEAEYLPAGWEER